MRSFKTIFTYDDIEVIEPGGELFMCVNEDLRSMFNIYFINYRGVRLWK